jgi:tRNA A-37 threonylcarbamoyl transferase component Bud32
MGEVYEATHDRLKGRYAVKVLLTEIKSRADVFQRFRREAEVTSDLRHPNIVHVIDFNVTPDGDPYLVMEYLDGIDLASELERVGAMPPSRVLDLVGQIASALAAAQDHKIVHRDLKPQNLFLLRLPGEDREVVKVVDFGISKVREATTKLTQDSAIIGTPQYMAPEQAQGKGLLIDERTDEFALATITYELFTGQPAFQGESPAAILYQVVHESPPPMPGLAPMVGPALDAVVRRAMSKSPQDRYPSALAFHHELVRAAAADSKVHTVALPESEALRPATALDRRADRTARPEPPTTLGLAAAPVDNRTLRAPRSWGRRLVLGMVGMLLLSLGAVALRQVGRAKQAPPPLPTQPAHVVQPEPAPRVETIQFVYSPEKRSWIQAVTADFERSHPEVHVDLVHKNSIETVQEILDGRLRVTAWSPADTSFLDMLNTDWHTKHGTDLFAADEDSRQPLVLTPLVFLVWEDRAHALKRAGGGKISWKTIRQGMMSPKGWTAIAGDARWATVTLAHANPTQSGCGLLALYSMLLEHTGRLRITPGDVHSAKNLDFLREIERKVAKFETSSAILATDMIRFGSSKYDIAVVFESNAIAALANAAGRWGKLQVDYPVPTLWSDNPAVVLSGSWVTEGQARAASIYIEYLRSADSQRQALAHGFRPADTSINLVSTDAGNPFTKYAAEGVSVEVPPAADIPDGTVVRPMLAAWTRMMRP